MLSRIRRLSRIDAIMLLAGAVALSSVLYPIIARERTRTYAKGIVLDADGKALPHATLRFRDGAGQIVATIAADENGQFLQPGMRKLVHLRIDGFRLTRFLPHTGGSDRLIFSAHGPQTAVFRDEAGTPIPALPLTCSADPRTSPEGWPRDLRSDARGRITLADIPGNASLQFRSRDPRFTVTNVSRQVVGARISYDVLLARAATIRKR